MDGSPRSALRSVGRDLRALGVGAPVRAGLEVAKRAGGHAVVFGRLATQTGDATAAPSTFVNPLVRAAARFGPTATPERGDPVHPPEPVRRRTLDAATLIAEGTVELFGRPIHVGPDPDWHARLDGDGAWPAEPWWQIDIRSGGRSGDVKWVWELGRHHHLVVLARAARIDADGPWFDVLEGQLTSFLDTNPPEVGIHWYSNLEIALRAIAWMQILALTERRLPVVLRSRMEAVLHHSGRHLLADLPYTLSTMRNNHLVGDALGLSLLGRAFLNDARARRWARVGDRIHARQLRHQVRADGSMLEDSMSYHRFVLEMLAVRALLEPGGPGDGATRAALRDSAQLLARLGVLEGEVPAFGDGDEGRVLTAVADRHDAPAPRHPWSGSVRLALAIAGHGAAADDRAAFDECAWYVPTGGPLDAEPAERDGRDIGGGLARATRGPWTVWLKAGGAPSHGHADLCSSPMRFGDRWVIGDPGTGTYNGPVEQRNHFRASIAHNVARVEGEDQLVPHRAFRWRHEAVGAIGEPLELAPGGEGDPSTTLLLWGWHGSYQRLAPPRRVVRTVLAGPAGVTVADWVEGPPVPVSTSFPIAPGLEPGPFAAADGEVRLAPAGADDGEDGHAVLHLAAPPVVHLGEEDPFDGWWSDTYGSMFPSPRLEVTTTATGPVVWSVRASADTDRTDTDRDDTAGGRWHAEGTALVSDTGHRISLEWAEDTILLRLVDANGHRVASMRTRRPG